MQHLHTRSFLTAAAWMLAVAPAWARAPRFDHVVIVVMENHRLSQVIGNPAAPFLTALSRQGANFTNAHGVAHPSQPNYLALFSGSTQGVVSDRCPQSFGDADNLAAQLAAAGLTFAGYSESMPGPGFDGCRAGNYARKHNPWVNFANVKASANQAASAFPADFATLPTVSFLIPNLLNDMHDGSVKGGDDWLAAHVDAYAQWAKSHNSLLIVTFDEADFFNTTNLIPTVLVGAGVIPGNYDDYADHYTMLATIEAMYDLPALTRAKPIERIFSVKPAAPPISTVDDH
ncbi:MAG TPA: alkaline phosphatase family protein [Telluria sp.]|nr:alkaline phosphatase family protein [Telluria sp.]